MTVFYFTGTGNSLAIAKRIGGNLISIPQVMDKTNNVYEDDVIGVIFPIYALAIPKIVLNFMQNTQLNADYCFAIGTYGNSPGSTMADIQKTASKNGYRFDYTDSILMVDNCIPIFEMGTEVAKLPKKKTEERTISVINNIRNKKCYQAKSSFAMRLFSAIISGLLKYDNFAKKYIINDQCNNCGICIKVCPAGNIKIQEKVFFNNHCSGCQACLHLCPQNAIHLKNEKSNLRWRNPEVSLNEIISANNRQGK